MKKRLHTYIHEQSFNPGILGLFINPFYFARKGLYHHMKGLAPRVQGRILDVGCGSKPYQSLFPNSEYIGMELLRVPTEADMYYDGHHFPFSDKEFDSVISSQVLEHVFNPEEFLTEISRVLKNGGLLLITVPFVWDEHEQPFDYARYSFFGLQYLLEKKGLEIIEHRKSMDDIRVIFQMINVYLFKKTLTQSSRINRLFTIIFMAPFNIAGEGLARILPSNDDLYLDNIILARKKDNF